MKLLSHFHHCKLISFLFAICSIVSSNAQSGNAAPVPEQDAFRAHLLEPQNREPELYEKMEWGISLPPQVNKFVDNWISNDQKHTKLNPAINPFDPDQIDITATIEYVKNGTPIIQRVYGFYYRDYIRVTATNNPDQLPGMDDPNKWDWQEKTSPYSFRIRWAADAISDYTMRVFLHVKGLGQWETEPYTFHCSSGNPSKSFIHLSENRHYFRTDDNKVYMPVGLNITEGSFGCNCREGVSSSSSCEDCYEWGTNDPCCGIRKNKRERMGMSGTSLEEYTLAPAAYIKLKKVLETISASGGNALRVFIEPVSFEIEFEKMNNYYDRQYQAWEFDRMLDECNDLNLRIELNLQYHGSICYHSFGYDRFDWDNTFNCIGCGNDSKSTGTNGFCYKNGCPDVKDPVDFLTNECALNNYKKKIRYIISRWGYSSNIYVLELMSEMNNIGGGTEWEVNIDTDGDGQKDDVREKPIRSLYDTDPARARKAVAFWHDELGRYIKEDLQHDRHLISADYTGQAPMTVDYNGDGDCLDSELGENCNPCQSDFFDYSWMSKNIDVIAFSNYSGSLNRWEKMTVHEYSKNNQSNGLMCGWNDPGIKDDDGKYNSPLGSYESLWKPVIHAENGLTSCMDADYTGFVKDILTDALGGHASSGMSWDEWSSTENWHYMGMVNSFLKEHVLDSTNIGKGNWIPDHSYSSRKGEFNKTKFAESVYMIAPEKDRSFGYVINRTWNYYTQGGKSCQSENLKNEFRDANEPLSRIREINPEEDHVFLKNIKNGKYIIRYIDPTTNAIVKSTIQKSKRGRLELNGYPTLGDGKKLLQPFYFYIISPIGGSFTD